MFRRGSSTTGSLSNNVAFFAFSGANEKYIEPSSAQTPLRGGINCGRSFAEKRSWRHSVTINKSAFGLSMRAFLAGLNMAGLNHGERIYCHRGRR